MPQFLLVARVAVVRAMDEALHAIQHHAKARPVMRLHPGAQMRQHRLDLAPVDIGTHRALEKRVQQMFVLVTHG